MKAFAFITGSHAYGTPTEDSDVDLVVPMFPKTFHDLWRALEAQDSEAEMVEYQDEEHGFIALSLRIEKLNLICAVSPEMWRAWKKGTDRLIKRRPVGREFAVKLLSRLRDDVENHTPWE